MTLDIDIEDNWPQADWQLLARQAASATHEMAPELTPARVSASLLFTSDAEIQALNREWRQRDTPTNVLSFPMLERDELLALEPEGRLIMLGDIAVAYETCAREAAEKGISLEDHTAHLIVHGLLHLAGHDHELGAEQARVMEALETNALALMGIADPYEHHDQH